MSPGLRCSCLVADAATTLCALPLSIIYPRVWAVVTCATGCGVLRRRRRCDVAPFKLLGEWLSLPPTHGFDPIRGCCIVVVTLDRYTPLKQIDGMPPAVEYDPIRCKGPSCGGILNPYW